MIASFCANTQSFSSLLPLLPEGIFLYVSAENFPITAIPSEEQAICQKWREKRVQHFVNGRVCAHRAVALMGGDSLIPIRRDAEKGVPLWPEGIIGSITHTEGVSAAVVALATNVKAVGIDVEQATRCHEGLWERIFSSSEIAWITKADTPIVRATAGFSLKESFYKCFSVLTGQTLDLVDIEILQTDSESSVRIIDKTGTFPGEAQAVWAVAGEYVLSVVIISDV